MLLLLLLFLFSLSPKTSSAKINGTKMLVFCSGASLKPIHHKMGGIVAAVIIHIRIMYIHLSLRSKTKNAAKCESLQLPTLSLSRHSLIQKYKFDGQPRQHSENAIHTQKKPLRTKELAKENVQEKEREKQRHFR